MPTGYAAPIIDDGIDFRTYALGCMRAFGAYVDFKDEPHGPAILKVRSDLTDHKEGLSDALKSREEFLLKSKPQQVAWAREQNKDMIKHANESLAKIREENRRLEAMAEQVRAWIPPSPEHERFKQFMLDQIVLSMTGEDYYNRSLAEAHSISVEEILTDYLEQLDEDVSYHQKKLEAGEKGNLEAQAWVDAIVNSLPPEKVEVAV